MNKKQIAKCIKKRGRIYHFSKTIAGVPVRKSLETDDANTAMDRAGAILAAAQAGKWDLIEGLKNFTRGMATVGELLDLFPRFAQYKGLSPVSSRQYMAALRLLVATAEGVEDVGGVSLARLDAGIVMRFQEKYMSNRDGSDPARVRRCANTHLRNARAVFSRFARQYFEQNDMAMPSSIDAFCKAPPLPVAAVQYELPPDELVHRTIAAGRALKYTAPDLYAVFVLAYDFALRAGEIAMCGPGWFEQGNGMLELVVKPRGLWAPKGGRTRAIPATVESHLELLAISKGGYFFTAENTERARYDLVTRKFSKWMQALGWDPKTYHKSAHELRKLMGSRWFTELGPQVAQEWLGHQDVSTTCRYYGRLMRGKFKPLEREIA